MLWKSQLKQESRLDPLATSPVGAAGLAQIMPATFKDLARTLRFPDTASPFDAGYAIEAGSYYDAKLRYQWRRNRPILEAHALAMASYNAGLGQILKAQALCHQASLWRDIQPCLALVTGAANSQQTTTYVIRVNQYWKAMENP